MKSYEHFSIKFEELFKEVMNKRVEIAEQHARSVRAASETIYMKPENFSWKEWYEGMSMADIGCVKPDGYINPSDKNDINRLDELIDTLIPTLHLIIGHRQEDEELRKRLMVTFVKPQY